MVARISPGILPEVTERVGDGSRLRSQVIGSRIAPNRSDEGSEAKQSTRDQFE
jgi:hypothetical protein